MTATNVLDSYWEDWDDAWEDDDLLFHEEDEELAVVEEKEILQSYARTHLKDLNYDYDPEDYPYGWTAEPF